MNEDISPSLQTVYSDNLRLCELPVHSPTQICVCDTVSPQISGTVYNCVVRQTNVRHVDVEVTCIFVNCNEFVPNQSVYADWFNLVSSGVPYFHIRTERIYLNRMDYKCALRALLADIHVA